MKPFLSIRYFLISFLIITFITPAAKSFSQSETKTDSLINSIINDSYVTNPGDKGVSLIKDEKFVQATQFYSATINNDATNTGAYMNRGVTQWAMNEPSNACRDWSAVLAMGDTAAFKLLDSHCHGKMVIDNDTIQKMQYHKMFALEKKDAKTSSANSNAMTIVDQMPEFVGGTTALLNYISKHLNYPVDAREKKLEGIVIVNFIISTKGKIMFPYIKKGLSNSCDMEALRIIRNMPAWKAGKEKGKNVLVRYNLPIEFSL